LIRGHDADLADELLNLLWLKNQAGQVGKRRNGNSATLLVSG
jgi:hypothetical protein